MYPHEERLSLWFNRPKSVPDWVVLSKGRTMLVGYQYIYIYMGRCKLILVRRSLRTDDYCNGNRYGRILYERTMIGIKFWVRHTIITSEVGKNAVGYEGKSETRRCYGKLWRDVHLRFRRSSCRRRHTYLVKCGRVDLAPRR